MILPPRSTSLLQTRRTIERTVTGFLIVQDGENPTTDYYLAPRLPPGSTRYAELAGAARGVQAKPGEMVVFCRYVNGGWLDWLAHNHAALAGVALFLDDDFDLVLRSGAAPWAYRRRVWSRHHRHLRRIAALVDELWVSTDVLAERYGDACLLLPPVPPALAAPPRRQASEPLIAYHATRVHRAELGWLAPILARVLAEVPQARCRIVGFPAGRRDLRRLSRTEATPQMPWPEYRRAAPAMGADVALAPLLPGPLNAARSHTKAFDIARLGAAGLYSDETPYRSLVRHGANGLSLPFHADAWAGAMLALLRDAPRRETLAAEMTRDLAERRTALLADRTLIDRLMAEPGRIAIAPADRSADGLPPRRGF